MDTKFQTGFSQNFSNETYDQSRINDEYIVFAKCKAEECTYDRGSIMHGIFLIIFGILNVAMSLAVFFQRKYDKKPFPFLMRCYHITIMVYYVTLLVWVLSHERSLHLLYATSYFLFVESSMLADGILAMMAIVRLFYVTAPFSAYSSKALNMCRLGVVCLFIVISGFNFKHYYTLYMTGKLKYELAHTIFYAIDFIINFAIIIACNITWIVVEKRRTTKLSQYFSKMTSQRSTDVIAAYMIVSSTVTVLCSVPYNILYLMPVSMVPDSVDICDFCRRYFTVFIVLYDTKVISMGIDNIMYCIFCPSYRSDLKKLFNKYFNGETMLDSGLQTPMSPTAQSAANAKGAAISEAGSVEIKS